MNAFALGIALLSSAQQWPLTRAERTGFLETSHYADVIRFVHELQDRGAPISLSYIGKTTEGRDMPLVVCAKPPVATPSEALRSGKAIVYVQGNIHAGEVEGKEAAQIVLRRLAQDPKLLDKLILLVNPIYNIDGNEKFGPGSVNRPSQPDPALVGVRANAQGFDLNRDCIKAESPEMRSLLEKVYTEWEPDVVMDLHTTNGTRHGYDLTYSPPLNPNTVPAVMKFTRDQLLPALRRQMPRSGGFEMFDYGNAARRESAWIWETFGHEGRYVTNYAGLRNRIGILSEAAAFIPFKDRVKATEAFVWATLEYIGARSSNVVSLTRSADAAVVSWGRNPETAPPFGVRFAMGSRSPEGVWMEKLAEGEARPRTGRPKALEKVRMQIYDRFQPTISVRFPSAYILSADESSAVGLLRRHGIVVEQLQEDWSGSVEAFVPTEVNEAATAFQGHKLIRLEGKTEPAQGARKGEYVVRTAQPLGVLAAHLLEPLGLDGVIAWGFLSEKPEVGSALPILKTYAQVTAPAVRVSSDSTTAK